MSKQKKNYKGNRGQDGKHNKQWRKQNDRTFANTIWDNLTIYDPPYKLETETAAEVAETE